MVIVALAGGKTVFYMETHAYMMNTTKLGKKDGSMMDNIHAPSRKDQSNINTGIRQIQSKALSILYNRNYRQINSENSPNLANQILEVSLVLPVDM